MNPKKILLADSGYTVRRIIELTITQEFGVELTVLESGERIKEKLLENTPAIVMVDVNLPVMDGYDVCRFINNEESLKNTEVLLMISNVEEIDKTKALGLNYNDVIKKPVDVNLLTEKVSNLLENVGKAEPVKSDDLNIEADPLNFDDINIGEEDLLPSVNETNRNVELSGTVLPSDEITQQVSEDDNLLVNNEDNLEEELPNPFEYEAGEDSMKEKDLPNDNIDGNKEPVSNTLNWTPQEEEIKGQFVQKNPHEVKEEIENKIDNYHEASNVHEEVKPEEFLQTRELEIKEEKIEPTTGDLDVKINEKEPIGKENYQIEHERAGSDGWTENNATDEKELKLKNPPPQEDNLPVQEEGPSKSLEDIMGRDFSANIEEEVKEDIDNSLKFSGDEKDSLINEANNLIEEQGASINDYMEKPEDTKEDLMEDDSLENKQTDSESIKKEHSILTPPFTEQLNFNKEDKERIIASIEDKLTASLKEVLWDVIPPIAEKIIKNEIDKINENIENQLKDLQ